MGSSLPPPATLDLVGSFARRDGDTIELLFARAEVPAGAGELSVTLSQGSNVVRAPATARPARTGQDVTVRVPESEVGDGVWSLELGRPSAEAQSPVTARLLVQGRRPVVLLWGPSFEQPKAKAAKKAAKKPAQKAGKTAAPTLAGRIAKGGSKALDAGLRPLPEAQATKIRDTARKIARTVLR
jgi:hypothetical protein